MDFQLAPVTIHTAQTIEGKRISVDKDNFNTESFTIRKVRELEDKCTLSDCTIDGKAQCDKNSYPLSIVLNSINGVRYSKWWVIEPITPDFLTTI